MQAAFPCLTPPGTAPKTPETKPMSRTATSSNASPKRAAIQMGLCVGVGVAVFFAVRTGTWYGGIAPGFLAGAMFAAVISWFAKRQGSRLTLQRPSFSNEKVILEGPANHFSGTSGVGGYLFLTNTRLLFLSHREKVQNHELSIPLDEIESADAGKTLGMISNSLVVKRTSDLTERFVVHEHERWRDAVLTAKAALP